jgi:hypothetical protein
MTNKGTYYKYLKSNEIGNHISFMLGFKNGVPNREMRLFINPGKNVIIFRKILK